MFENKYAKLPDEPPPMPAVEIDPLTTVNTGRNNGPLSLSTRKRSRNSSKNLSNLGITGQHSSMITSSDDGASTDESSGDDMQINDENTLKQLRVLQDQVKIFSLKKFIDLIFLFLLKLKYFGDTINQLIQRENDRLTLRGKRKPKVKRNKTKVRGPRQTSTLSNIPTPIPNALNDQNRLSSLTSINSSLLPPNAFTGTQSTMPPTATRNPSVSMATKKAGNSTLAGLLTPTTTGGYPTGGVLPAPNGTSQFGNVYSGQNLLTDTNVGKQPQATKNTTPMTGISAGLANRGSGKGSRGAGAGSAGPKRLVDKY